MLVVHHIPADKQDPSKDLPWPGMLNPMLASTAAFARPLPDVDTSNEQSLIVKVCGMRDPENIRAVETAGADWMGFIHCRTSPRHVEEVPAYLPTRCRRVGVFVDAPTDLIAERTAAMGLTIIQLHGHETPDYCRVLRQNLPENVALMKMLPIATREDLLRTADYDDAVDLFLLETKRKATGLAHYGGSGQQFDWALLDAYASIRPFLLSGGIGPEDAATIVHLHHPRLAGVDLNSRFEIQPALKDAAEIRKFIQTIRQPL